MDRHVCAQDVLDKAQFVGFCLGSNAQRWMELRKWAFGADAALCQIASDTCCSVHSAPPDAIKCKAVGLKRAFKWAFKWVRSELREQYIALTRQARIRPMYVDCV